MDSGATCHRELQNLSEPREISLGDGHVLQAIAKGFISPGDAIVRWKLSKVSSMGCIAHP